MDLAPRLRTATTLGVLTMLLLLGLVWGVTAVTKPFPSLVDTPTPTGPCTERRIADGQQVRRADVTVSVYNAGTTDGQAGRLLEKLVLAEFPAGETGNAPAGTKVGAGVQVWTDQPGSPAVRLVVSVFGQGNATVVEKAGLGPGVTVIVGNDLPDLRPGLKQAKAQGSFTVCSPPLL